VYDIKTADYIKPVSVNMDGKSWTMTAPGAGTELKMGQIQRRLGLLEKKVENNTANEEDLDKYDRLESETYGYFKKLFKDSTEDNSEVEEWLQATPIGVVYAIIEDIKDQKQAKDGKPTEPESS